MKKRNSFLFLAILSLLLNANFIYAATRVAKASGNWSSSSTWDSGVPGAGDVIEIGENIIVTVDVNTAIVSSITIKKATSNNGITISGTNTLNISGAITTTMPEVSVSTIINVGAGTLNVGSINLAGGGAAGKNCELTISSGVVNVTGSITFTNTAAQAKVTFTGAGTINVAGNFTPGAFTAFSGSLVNFNGTGAQTVGNFAYNNLSFTNSSTKTLTLTSNQVISGNLTVYSGANFTTAGNYTLGITGTTNISGTLTLGGTSAKTFTGDVTMNSGSTWNETGSSAYTISGNFTNNATTFTTNTGVHTFNGSSKVLSGATTFSIPSTTFTGAYTNSGTLTCATLLTVTGVTLTNTGTINSATSLTGTGTLANTSGTVNITGGSSSITTYTNGGTFAISGTATSSTALANFTNTGTINISGSGTITGITNNAGGIVNHSGSSTITSFDNATSTSTLIISTTPTVPTFTTLTVSTAGNTVNYNGAGTQAIKAVAYSNLILSGSAAKSITTGTSVTGNISINGASASIGAALNISVGTLTLGGLYMTNGTWGGTGSGASNINTTYFAATSGILTVSTAVQGLTASAPTPVDLTGFTARWSAAASATGYQLDVSTENTFTSGLISGYNNLDVSNVTSFAITGLAAATPYFYRVRAYNTGATSSNSNTISITTFTRPTTNSSGFSVSGATTISIDWSTNGDGTHRLVAINNTNFFVPPVDRTDYSGLCNTTWQNAGPQWVYDGLGSPDVIDITTGAGLNISNVWVAVYEYNLYSEAKAVVKIYKVGTPATATQDGEGGTLPIQLISFSAIKSNENALVKWIIANEENNDFFSVEKSYDGKEFFEVAQVEGNGNSSLMNDYQVLDKTKMESINYYRLKQTDYDGKFTYSKMIALMSVVTENFEISNSRVSNSNTLHLEVQSGISSSTNFELMNALGQKVYSAKLEIEAGKSVYSMNMPKLASGIYFIRLEVGGIIAVRKIVL